LWKNIDFIVFILTYYKLNRTFEVGIGIGTNALFLRELDSSNNTLSFLTGQALPMLPHYQVSMAFADHNALCDHITLLEVIYISALARDKYKDKITPSFVLQLSPYPWTSYRL